MRVREFKKMTKKPRPIPAYAYVIMAVLLILFYFFSIVLIAIVLRPFQIEKYITEIYYISASFGAFFTFLFYVFINNYVLTKIYYKKSLNIFTHEYYFPERLLMVISLIITIIFNVYLILTSEYGILGLFLIPLSFVIFVWVYFGLFYYLGFWMSVVGYRKKRDYARFHPDNYGRDSIRWIYED